MIFGGLSQAHEAHVGGGYWVFSSFHAAHAVLDNLFTYVADLDSTETSPNPLRLGESER